MNQRERQNQPETPSSATPVTEPGNLPELRQSAQALLAIGDEAIRKALSSDSDKFLSANRQTGGE